MKALTGLLLLVIFASACRQTNDDLAKHLAGTDSVAINYFKGDGTMDTVITVRVIRDTAIVQQLAAAVAENETKGEVNCGQDGSLHFFRKNQVVQDVDFRLEHDCTQFSFRQLGIVKYSKVSAAAKDLLLDLKQSVPR